MRDRRESSILHKLFFLAIPLSLVAAACSGTPVTGTATPASIPSVTPSAISTPTPVTSSSPLPGTTPTLSSQCTAATWSLDFTRSGGLAGKTASLHLTSAGPASAAQPDQHLVIATAIPPEDLTRIGKLLESACPFTSSLKPKICPDCFSYALNIQLDGHTYSAHATDVDLSGLGVLIETLNILLNQSLASHP